MVLILNCTRWHKFCFSFCFQRLRTWRQVWPVLIWRSHSKNPRPLAWVSILSGPECNTLDPCPLYLFSCLVVLLFPYPSSNIELTICTLNLLPPLRWPIIQDWKACISEKPPVMGELEWPVTTAPPKGLRRYSGFKHYLSATAKLTPVPSLYEQTYMCLNFTHVHTYTRTHRPMPPA